MQDNFHRFNTLLPLDKPVLNRSFSYNLMCAKKHSCVPLT